MQREISKISNVVVLFAFSGNFKKTEPQKHFKQNSILIKMS